MAGPIRITVTANADQANRALQNTSSRAQRLGSTFKKAALPAAAALGAIGGAAIKAGQAAAEDAAAQAKLAQALKTGAGATKAQVAQTEAYIEAQGKLYGTTDDELRPAIAQLATATGSVTKAQKLATLAQDIAAGSGKSLESVTKKLAKAQTTGGASALSAYGARTKDAEGNTRSLAQVTDDLAKKYRGAAASAADTAAGKQKKLQLQMGELQEQIGAGLLPIMGKLVSFGLRVVGFFQRNETVAKVLVIALAAVAVAILAVNAAMLLNPAVLIVAGIVALVAALVLAYKRSTEFRDICDQVASFVRTKVLPALQEFGRYFVAVVIPAVVATAKAIAARLKPILEQLGETFRTQIAPTIAKVVAKFRDLWPQIKQVIKFVAKAYATFLRFAAAVAGRVIPVIIRVAGFLISRVVPAVADVIGIIIRVIARAVAFGRAFIDTIAKLTRWVSGVKEKGGQVLDYVRSIPTKATNALGDLVATLVQKGKDLIAGLLDGIKEGVQNAIGYVSSIPGILSNAFGGGGRLGILTIAVQTANAQAQSAAAAGNAGNPSADAALAGSGGLRTAVGAPIVVNVTAPVGSSAADIGRELTTYLDAWRGVGGRARAY